MLRGFAIYELLILAYIAFAIYFIVKLIKANRPQKVERHNKAQTVKFCRNCGTATEGSASACINCGFPPLTEQKYCHNCGIETKEDQVLCVNCKTTLRNEVLLNSSNKQEPDVIAAIVGFLLPIVGLVLYLVWKEDYPGKAGSAKMGAIAAVKLLIAILVVMALIVMAFY